MYTFLKNLESLHMQQQQQHIASPKPNSLDFLSLPFALGVVKSAVRHSVASSKNVGLALRPGPVSTAKKLGWRSSTTSRHKPIQGAGSWGEGIARQPGPGRRTDTLHPNPSCETQHRSPPLCAHSMVGTDPNRPSGAAVE